MMFLLSANYHGKDDPLCTCDNHDEDGNPEPTLLVEANSAQEAMERYVSLTDPDTDVSYRVDTIEILDTAEFKLDVHISQKVELGVV